MREIRLHLSSDMALPTSPIAGALPEIKGRFQDNGSDVVFMSDDETTVPGLIRFKRWVIARWDTKDKRFVPIDEPFWEWEPSVLLVVKAEFVVDRLNRSEDELADWIQDSRMLLGLGPADQIIVIIKGLGSYQSKTKSLANREYTAAARANLAAGGAAQVNQPLDRRLSKEEIDNGLIAVQVLLGVNFVQGGFATFTLHQSLTLVERTEEMEDWIWNLGADVALRPVRCARFAPY